MSIWMKSEEQCTKIGKRVMEVLHTNTQRHAPCPWPSWNLPRPTTGACISVYHWRNSDGVSWKTPWRCQYWVDRLSEPTTLVPDISSDYQVVVADGGRIIWLATERGTLLGCLPCANEWTADCTGKLAVGQAGRGGKTFALTRGKFRPEGDGEGGQRRLWDWASSWRIGNRHWGGGTHYVPPMVTELWGRGLGVPPCWYAERLLWGEPDGNSLGSPAWVTQWRAVYI